MPHMRRWGIGTELVRRAAILRAHRPEFQVASGWIRGRLQLEGPKVLAHWWRGTPPTCGVLRPDRARGWPLP